MSDLEYAKGIILGNTNYLLEAINNNETGKKLNMKIAGWAASINNMYPTIIELQKNIHLD